jgi:hypothetical protein
MAVWQIGPGAWPNLGTVLAQGAQAWDTVMLLQAGSPYGAGIWDVPFPSPIHIVGEPGPEPVRVNQIMVALAQTPPAHDWWIENLEIRNNFFNSGMVRLLAGATWGGMRLVLHQCRDPANVIAAALNGMDQDGGGRRILMARCSSRATSSTAAFFLRTVASDEVEISRCVLNRAPEVHDGEMPTILAADYVTAPVAGYGPDYQTFWNPIVAQPRAMSGTLLLEGGSHDRAQILVYRVLDDGAADSAADLEGHAWRVVRPDPVTGYWEVRLLPATRPDGAPQRYAYTVWTPEGYAPQTHGRYLPAPAP